MPAGFRQMRLTEALLPPQRHYDDPGPMPGIEDATEADYRCFVADILAGQPEPGEFWIFAYGSLIWKPACDFIEIRTGIVRGWHRSFCLGWNTRFRGCEEHPGLMLALDRGGACKGVLYRLPPNAVAENLELVCRREMSHKPSAFPPRWVTAESEGGPVPALTFCIDRKSGRYVSGLDADETARVLARAEGHRGSMAEYLFHTVSHLEQMGIHDRYLWRLQELVAAQLEAAREEKSRA
jgi:cation transport protein ChaC